jgi:hypothetical protein
MPCDDETRWRANINIAPASHQEKENTVFTFRPFLLLFFTFLKKSRKVIPATFQITWQVSQKVGHVSKVDHLKKYTYLEM